MTIPLITQLREVEREIEARRKVYAHKIQIREMDPDRAERKIDLMLAVAETLRDVMEDHPFVAMPCTPLPAVTLNWSLIAEALDNIPRLIHRDSLRDTIHNLASDNDALRERIAALEQWNADMVAKTAAGSLDGYRELGAKCAALEAERDEWTDRAENTMCRAERAEARIAALRHVVAAADAMRDMYVECAQSIDCDMPRTVTAYNAARAALKEGK